MIMFCNQCGKKLPDDAKFCTYCGAQIHRESADDPADNKQITNTTPAVESSTYKWERRCIYAVACIVGIFLVAALAANIFAPAPAHTMAASSSAVKTIPAAQKKSDYPYHTNDMVYNKITAIVIKKPGDIATIRDAGNRKDEAELQSLMMQGRLYLIDQGTRMIVAEDQPYITGYVAVIIDSGANIDKTGYVPYAVLTK